MKVIYIYQNNLNMLIKSIRRLVLTTLVENKSNFLNISKLEFFYNMSTYS